MERAALNRAFTLPGHTPSLSTLLKVLPHLGLRIELTEVG
jgi:DNA-binding phage protein